MQTFLPFADFRASAEVLDDKRLGKQRVETLQVMRALTLPGYGWQSHPVTAMWRGYRPALMAYQDATCSVWLERGFADTCLAKTLEDLARFPEDLAAYERGDFPVPAWNTDEAVHVSHRSKLVQKDREHYRPLFPDVPDDLEYVWPVPSASAKQASSKQAGTNRASTKHVGTKRASTKKTDTKPADTEETTPVRRSASIDRRRAG